MKKILLVCGAGMSTSLLVKRMREADSKREFDIKCCDLMSAKLQIVQSDIVLLAPHVAYIYSEYETLSKDLKIPLMIIDKDDYREMNGERALYKVIDHLCEHEKKNPFKVAMLHSPGGIMSDILCKDMLKNLSQEESGWVIETYAIDQFEEDDVSVILLEPQIKYEKSQLQKRMGDSAFIDIPNMALYASFNGRKMLDYIHLLENKRKEEKQVEIGEEKI